AVSASTKDSTATTTATILTPRKGIVFQEPGKCSRQRQREMVEPKKPMKKKELTRLDEEIASKLQAEFDEEVRLVREKAEKEQEANVVLTKEWDDIQAKIEADHELAQKLQAQEQEELSDAKKARLIVQLLEKRRKHFVAKRAKEKRNIPPTRSQQRSIICTYLKNMEGWKPKSLKNKTELVEESSKKAKTKQEESSKKDEAEIAQESNDGDDVNIDATPLSTKSPTIMLKNIDREDLKVLWSIVKARFKKTEPVNYMDNFLLFNLKTMFEHHVEDNNMLFYLLVEKMYPLINHTLHQMFNDVKLQVDYECEMVFKLLRLVKK
ncbi:hypothetical protein Tco_1269610, partial [Tanacetum coccineum]